MSDFTPREEPIDDDEEALPDPGIQDAAAVDLYQLMSRIFPVDPTTWTSRLLGMQKRSVDRMSDGYSRMPPRVVEKLNRQAAIKERMMAKIEAAVREAQAEGAHSMIVKYSLIGLSRTPDIEKDDGPL